MKTNRKQLLMPGMMVTVYLPMESMSPRVGIIQRIHDDRAYVFVYTFGAGGFGVSRWLERIQISL